MGTRIWCSHFDHSIAFVMRSAILFGNIALEVPPCSFGIEHRLHGSQNTDDGIDTNLDGAAGAKVRELEGGITRILVVFRWWFSGVVSEAGCLMEESNG